MRKYISVLGTIMAIVMSCKGEPEKKTEAVPHKIVEETNEVQRETNETTAAVEPSEVNDSVQEEEKDGTTYVLKKVSDWRNENESDYLLYTKAIGDELLTFHNKGRYGVLEHYNVDGNDLTDYYIFPKPTAAAIELRISLKDTLFSVMNKEIDDSSEVSMLLNDYILAGVRSDASYPYYAIIDVNERKMSGYFSTHGEFKVSPDQKFLIGWKDTEEDIEMNTVCPDLEGECCYVVTKEFRYELSTGEESETGKLGCGFVQ